MDCKASCGALVLAMRVRPRRQCCDPASWVRACVWCGGPAPRSRTRPLQQADQSSPVSCWTGQNTTSAPLRPMLGYRAGTTRCSNGTDNFQLIRLRRVQSECGQIHRSRRELVAGSTQQFCGVNFGRRSLRIWPSRVERHASTAGCRTEPIGQRRRSTGAL